MLGFETTLKKAVQFTGKGLHHGLPSTVTVHPAFEKTGIIFLNLSNSSKLLANFKNIVNTNYCTVLGSSNSTNWNISTVEHLLAALHGCNINNALIELHQADSEIPILDGSSKPFVDAFLRAGIEKMKERRTIVKILKEVKIDQINARKTAILAPSDKKGLKLTATIDFPAIKQKFTFDPETMSFADEIAPARTFTFKDQLDKMAQLGLAKGGSLENAVVFDENGKPLNPEGLRFENEAVRHKILDCIGDLSLGGNLQGEYYGIRPGHQLNHQLLTALFSDKSNYEIVTQ